MKFLLASLLFIIPFFSFSQDDFIVRMDENRINARLYGYYIDTVFSITEDSLYLGPVATGAFNKITPARFQNSISSEIATLISRSGMMTPAGKGLALRINTLKTWEITGGSSEFSLVIMNVSFLEHENGSWKELFQGSSSFKKSGMDVTHQHDENITQALENIIWDFNRRQDDRKLRPYPVEDITKDPNSGKPYYQVFKNHLRRGLYQTFYDFRDQFPDTTTHYRVGYDYKGKDTSKVVVQLQFDDRKLKDYPFAYCNGKKYFLRMGKGYYPLEVNDTSIVSLFHAGISSDSNIGDATAIVFSSVMFGLVGALVSTAIVAGSSASEMRGTQTMPMQLNFVTGALEKPDVLDGLVVKSTNIFYLSPTARAGTTVTVTVDTVSYTLQRGDYCSIRLGRCNGKKIHFSSSTGLKGEQDIEPKLFCSNLFLLHLKSDMIDCDYPAGEVRTSILRKINTYPPVKQDF